LEKDLKISWAAISRVNTVNEEMVSWMRKSGCIQISYGVESGSEKIRNQLNKHIKTDQIKKAFALTTSYGILSRAYFIYGSPSETWATIRETSDLINEIKPLSVIFYILDIFPGTSLYHDFLKKSGLTDDIWLKHIEDIMYFETDAELSRDLVLAFGKRLRSDFYENLPRFVDQIKLVDKKEFYALHSDFLSRLALTFSHGDYAAIKAIKGKDRIAKTLYLKSLDYHPDSRAYLGLGILLQKKGAYEESIRMLIEGLQYFPESEPLHMCLGTSFMNTKQYEKALACFQKFQNSKEAAHAIANCHMALGNADKAAAFLRR
jgi:tetratricopeptide (TPR) repeat protein